ncbi:MAG TPA: hypothetical protein VMU13_00745 [Candidatus Paceibacterota bacterium]|nr:hypothetical protein [Candidatus Paceibacterota bacterium]
MVEEIPVGDSTYVSSKRASEISAYAQDYIGQLARAGHIAAKRVGGLWYIDMNSLEAYRSNPIANQRDHRSKENGYQEDQDTEALVSFDGKNYISASRASKLTGYNQDYVGQLARSGKLLAKQVGSRWYVERDGLLAHKKEKDSLLAAVQADAVGIGLYSPTPVLTDDHLDIQEMPLLQYSPESRDLRPILRSKDTHDIEIKRQSNEYSQKGQNSETFEDIGSKKSIKIGSQDDKKTPPENFKNNTKKESQKNLIYLAFGGFLLLLMGLVLVLILKLKTPSEKNSNIVIIASENALNQLTRSFEDTFSPELQYKRD